MKAGELDEIIHALGMNYESFARSVGCARDTISRMTSGKSTIPGAIADYARERLQAANSVPFPVGWRRAGRKPAIAGSAGH